MHYQRMRRGADMDAPPNAMPGRGRLCGYGTCDSPHLAKGFCSLHYHRAKEGRDMDAPNKLDPSFCAFGDCEAKHFGVGYCKTHYYRHINGRPMDAPIKRWKPLGAKRIVDGYVKIKIATGKRNSRNWMLEHRYVMEQHLGRPLTSDETVHHLNGDRADNRLENLELWSTSQPKGQRVEDKVAWAREFLAKHAARSHRIH